MSEAAPEVTPAQETPAADQAKPAEQPKADDTDWKAEARKWEARAKENSGAAKAAEKARLDAMSESERAIEEAKQAARTEAATNYGKRLARTEFDAIAARRNPEFDTASALEFVDLARFVGEDGEPDTQAIKAAVERLVPEKAEVKTAPSFGGGARKADIDPDVAPGTGRLAAAYAARSKFK